MPIPTNSAGQSAAAVALPSGTNASAERIVDLPWNQLAPLMSVLHLPTLGALHRKAAGPQALRDVFAAAGTGEFLLYDKDRRWGGQKHESIMDGVEVHAGHVLIPTVDRHTNTVTGVGVRAASRASRKATPPTETSPKSRSAGGLSAWPRLGQQSSRLARSITGAPTAAVHGTAPSSPGSSLPPRAACRSSDCSTPPSTWTPICSASPPPSLALRVPISNEAPLTPRSLSPGGTPTPDVPVSAGCRRGGWSAFPVHWRGPGWRRDRRRTRCRWR